MDLDLVGEGGVGSGKRGFRGNELLEDGLLVGGSTGKVVQDIVIGVEEARARVEDVGMGCIGLAQVVSPPSGTETVGPLLVRSKVGSLPGSPGLIGRVKFLPNLSGGGEGVGSQKGSGGQDGQGLVGDG